MSGAAPLTDDPADSVLLRSGAVAGVPRPAVPPDAGTGLRLGDPDGAPPLSVTVPRRPARAKRPRRYRLRGRHARERGRLRVPVSLSVVATVTVAEDRAVLQVLRDRAVCDLGSAQVAALAALPPSVAVPSLDRLVRLGLVRRHVVGGHERFGLL